MTAGESVPVEATVEFARGVYGTQWPMLNPKVREEILADYANGLAAALPSLREQIAAEVLGPVRALLDEYERFMPGMVRDLRAALSAPVQGAEPHDFRLSTSDGVSTRCTRCDLWVGKWDGSSPCPVQAAEPVHWIGDAPTSLHGNGAASFERTSRDPAAVTCGLCRTLLAREATEEVGGE